MLIATYKDLSINILELYDKIECKIYLKISIYSNSPCSLTIPNSFLDVLFNINDAPEYVYNLYNHIKRKSKISLTPDGLAYIIQGPCLSQKSKIFIMSQVFINDYTKMLSKESEYVYDLETSLFIADETIKPIYIDIFTIII